MNFIGITTITENLLKRKWSIVILRHLNAGITNAADICRLSPGLTPTALNERLRTMQRYGLITRHPRRAMAMIIAYQLTERGHKILRLLILIERLDELPCQDEGELRLTGAAPAQPVVREQRPPPPAGARPVKKTGAGTGIVT